MKKLGLIFGLLFLVACSGTETEADVMTLTTCQNDQRVITIESNEDEIVRFTINIMLSRAEFNTDFLQDADISDDDIRSVFLEFNQLEEGITFRLARLTAEYAMIEMSYDYGRISPTELAQMWDVESFDTITLEAVTASLENGNMNCVVEDVAHSERAELETQVFAPAPLQTAPTVAPTIAATLPPTEAPTEPTPTVGVINSNWINFMRHPGWVEADIILSLHIEDVVTIIDYYYNDDWASVEVETTAFSEIPQILQGFVLRAYIDPQ